MEENEDKFIIKKIPLEEFLNILTELYDRGLDFIDVICIKVSENENDVILSYTRDYMNSDAPGENFEKLKEIADEPEKGLTDEDINRITL